MQPCLAQLQQQMDSSSLARHSGSRAASKQWACSTHNLPMHAAHPCWPAGRLLALLLARLGREWRVQAAARMPEARGDIREIVGQPVFVPLYNLYLTYGKLFRLRWGLLSCVSV
jgi:hypothetical protein